MSDQSQYMKAVVCPQYGPPEVLQLTQVKKPIPQRHEVLVKVHATSATVADFRIRSFTVPASFWIPARLVLGIFKPNVPILGMELAGEIEAVGDDVKNFKVGDKVFAASRFGAYAEYRCLPADGPIAIKPTNIRYADAAVIPIGACTALHYLRRAKIEKGNKVLIYGASGSVGTYAVQLARHFGASVTGVCSSTNAALVKSLGADEVVDYTSPGFTDKLGVYDVVFIAIDKFPFALCGKVLRRGGVYLNVTAPVKSLSMLWASVTGKFQVIVGESPPEKASELNYLKELVESGIVKPVMDRTYPLTEIVDAHRYVDLGHKRGNVAILVRD